MDTYNRTRNVFLHYKLPYDSEPPEGWIIYYYPHSQRSGMLSW